MAANIFTGATNANWGTATNWSLGTVPTASDGHIATLDGTSPASCVLNTASVCNVLDCTGYTGTLSGSSGLTISGNLTWASGMTITTTGYLNVNATSTIVSNGVYWSGNYVIIGVGHTITLSDDFNITGNWLHTTTSGTVTFNGNKINLKGNFTASSGRSVAGTTTLTFNGTSGTSTLNGSGVISCDTNINSSNIIAIVNLNIGGGVFTYTTSSSISHSGTLTLSASCTINTAGISWDNITISAASTITNNSLLTATGTLTTSSINATFIGTAGFTVTNYSMTTGDNILKFGNTYTITNLTAVGTAANTGSFSSNTGGSKVNLVLAYGGTQDNGFLSATDVDSSLGQTIYTRKGTLSNTTNWRLLVAPTTITTST